MGDELCTRSLVEKEIENTVTWFYLRYLAQE
jgi:hypothetical protein